MSIFDSTPSSQKADARPISFVLADLNVGSTQKIDLYVRPEELTRTDPSRVSVQQTLDKTIWADNFGPGVSTINISGHTGWRMDAQGKDGGDRFIALKTQFFDGWHQAKAKAYASGQDPNKVFLAFADTLDNFVCEVIPNQITLRRSRSRPLLMTYQIGMTVAMDLYGSYVGTETAVPPTGSALTSLGLGSLLDAIGSITSFAQGISSWINSNILAPVKSFLAMTTKIFNAVQGAIKAVSGIASSIINVARTIAQAGTNLMHTITSIMAMPGKIKAMFMGIASAFTNIACTLKNAFGANVVYQDYTPLFGASNCSSTAGGKPISEYRNTNPFYAIAPSAGQSPVSINASAQSSLTTLAKADPVLSPMTPAQLASHVTTINNGVAVTS
jgi:hypothetical protein